MYQKMGAADFTNPFEAAVLSRTHAILGLKWHQDFIRFRTKRAHLSNPIKNIKLWRTKSQELYS